MLNWEWLLVLAIVIACVAGLGAGLDYATKPRGIIVTSHDDHFHCPNCGRRIAGKYGKPKRR